MNINEACEDLREKGQMLSRWGLFNSDGVITKADWDDDNDGEDWRGPEEDGYWDAVCYASLYSSICPTVKAGKGPISFFSPFPGYSQPGLEYARQLGDGSYTGGTKESLVWLKYILGKNSPWKALQKNVVSADLDWVNTKGGIVIEDVGNVPARLLFNFLQAYRKPFEYPNMFALWLELREEFDERTADFLTCALQPMHYYDTHKAQTWRTGTAWSGHIHLHDANPGKYWRRYTTASPVGLKMTFLQCDLNPGKNASVWDGSRAAAGTYDRDKFHRYINDMEVHNAA